MAALDDLIAQIEDKAVRERIKQEWKRHLDSQNVKFGLVFQDHLPELTPIYNAKVRVRSKVAIRDGLLTDLWYVLSISDGEAHCRNIGSGETREIPVDDLVVVRQFGEPIFPALVPVDKIQNGSDDAPWHTLIEADNYHALQLLEYLYAGKVDCIYIDPPYNSGARDWKYNNDYVDANDAWRHSKWLAMMKRRLNLAKQLLNPEDSVLIVTIDEKEYLRLGLLLEQVFPEARMQMISSTINPKGSARGKEFYRVDEYIFFLMFGSSAIQEFFVPGLCVSKGDTATNEVLSGENAAVTELPSVRWASLLRSGSGSKRTESHLKFYPIYVDEKKEEIIGCGDPLPLGEHPKEDREASDVRACWPTRQDGSEGRWQLKVDSFRDLLKNGFVKIGSISHDKITFYYLMEGQRKKVENGELVITGKDKYGGIVVEYARSESISGRPKTQWMATSHSATDHGTSMLRKILPGRSFPFPKSLFAVEDALRFIVGKKKEALILDFFSGSGTTAHAVMRLNRQDDGRRQCISVTNNEVAADEDNILRKQGLRPGDPDWEKWGICKYITMPRIAAAITGKTPDGQPIKGDYKFNDSFPMSEGFPANLEYFRLDFLDKDHVALGRQFREILPILWLRSGAIGPRPELSKNKPIPVMVIPEHNTFAVLIEETRFADFAAELEGRSNLTYAYLVTDSEEAFQEMAGQLKVPNVIQLYRDYLENFVINKGEGVA